jgi:replication factor A1
MAIKDLQARQGNVDITARVISVDQPKEFNKFGKVGKVATATIQDETGTIKLSLWNEQIEKAKIGDKVRVQNGYVNEFRGELQLTTGKFGTLEVVEGAGQMVGKLKSDEGEHILTPDEKTEEQDLDELGKKGPAEFVIADEVTDDELEEADIEEEKM